MLSKVSKLVFIAAVWLHAGKFFDLQKKISREMGVSNEQIMLFEKWIWETGARCQTQYGFEEKRNCLVQLVYRDVGIRFDTTKALAPDDLLPLNLQKGKTGNCLSISFLVLVLGEAIGLRGEPVSLPGHVYLHFPGGANWESNREGYAYSDEEYRKKYDIDPSKGRFARTLDVDQFEGMIRYEWANRLLIQGKKQESLVQYQKAEMLWKDARVAGNRALLLESMGNAKQARKILDSLWNGGARSEELVWNRSLLMLRNGEALINIQLFLEEAEGRWIQSNRLRDLKQRIDQELSR